MIALSPRQFETSPEHEALVRKALVRLVSDVQGLIVINVGLRMGRIDANLQISTFGDHDSRYDASQYSQKAFEPDILGLQEIGQRLEERYGHKERITDLAIWVVEAETGARNLLTDTYRRTAYKLLKLRDENQRHPMKLILAIYDDVKLPERIDPFDEVWQFSRERGSDQPSAC